MSESRQANGRSIDEVFCYANLDFLDMLIARVGITVMSPILDCLDMLIARVGVKVVC